MEDQWQRCASGVWSEVIACAGGTMCSPSGFSSEMAVDFSDKNKGNDEEEIITTSGSIRMTVNTEECGKMNVSAALIGASTLLGIFWGLMI